MDSLTKLLHYVFGMDKYPFGVAREVTPWDVWVIQHNELFNIIAAVLCYVCYFGLAGMFFYLVWTYEGRSGKR